MALAEFPEGLSKEQQQEHAQAVTDHIVRLVLEAGYTYNSFHKENGIALAANRRGTPMLAEKVRRILDVLEATDDVRRETWDLFHGTNGQATAQDKLRQWITEAGSYEKVAELAGVGKRTIEGLNVGNKELPKEKRIPLVPPLKQWKAIATKVGKVSEEEAYELWREAMLTRNKNEGRTRTGSEVDILLEETDIVLKDCIQDKNNHAFLRDFKYDEARGFFGDVRRTGLYEWSRMESLMRTFKASPRRKIEITQAWLEDSQAGKKTGENPAIILDAMRNWAKWYALEKFPKEYLSTRQFDHKNSQKHLR